ncbi:hypothetical protein EI998_03355 [Streptococcus suis]|uniref:Uncharacterized protein n=1 Tax=Streptococcus suis TaxID=1307 RepID=A0A426TH51_STRSU|nr:hypothetical protein EI998_03355 [Streptococcus suis]
MIGLAYSRSVYLLLLRRMRKRRFLISNFKHSTGLFELALPYPGTACSFWCEHHSLYLRPPTVYS